MIRRSIWLFVALGVVSVAWLPSAAAYGRPNGTLAASIRVYENPAVIQGLTTRPAQLTLSADRNYTITGLRHWQGWGTPIAGASGINHVNNCVPDCADGHVAKVHVTVQLSKRGKYQGHYVYQCYAVKPAAAAYLRHFCLP
jgi:hypothetical protein